MKPDSGGVVCSVLSALRPFAGAYLRDESVDKRVIHVEVGAAKPGNSISKIQESVEVSGFKNVKCPYGGNAAFFGCEPASFFVDHNGRYTQFESERNGLGLSRCV